MLHHRNYFLIKRLMMNICIKRVACLQIFLSCIISSFSCAAPHASRQVTITTIADALSYVRKVMSNFPDDIAAEQAYEKAQSGALIICAKILYDNVYVQILAALQEIDARIKYWQEQRNHQWRYFLTKNPLKWVTGKSQQEEIENNIGQLQSHQGELYVLLGQLVKLGNVYDHQQKTVFVKNYQAGYAWIDELLHLLPRIKVEAHDIDSGSPFIARVMLLRLKLGKVRRFKHDILSEIADTRISAHLERNWFKYGALMMGLVYSYNNFDQLKSSFLSAKDNFDSYIVDPIKGVIKDVFMPEHIGGGDADMLSGVRTTSLESIKQFVADKSGTYGISNADEIVKELENNNYGPYQNFLDLIASKEHLSEAEKSDWTVKQMYQQVKGGVAKFSDLSDFVVGKIYFYELLGLSNFVMREKQFAAVTKLILLTPAAFVGWLGYSGYKKFTAKDYASLRRALVDINSLFVDQTRPLDDERYGKMIYLVHNLKQQAEQEAPLNVRDDFIDDLEMIELQEYDVAAKRRIVEDMFRKYSFLGLAH